MKDKLLSIFVAFVRKTFSKDRLLDLIDDLLDVVYDRFAGSSGNLEERVVDQENVLRDMKEVFDDANV